MSQVIEMRPRRRKRDLVKKLCQSIGLASILLVMNYGDLLGGGSDVRMHVPYALTGICLCLLYTSTLFYLLGYPTPTLQRAGPLDEPPSRHRHPIFRMTVARHRVV